MQAKQIVAIVALEALGARALSELGAGALDLGKDGFAPDLGGAFEPDFARSDRRRCLALGLVGDMGDALCRAALARLSTTDNRLSPRPDASRACALCGVLCSGFCSRHALLEACALRLDGLGRSLIGLARDD